MRVTLLIVAVALLAACADDQSAEPDRIYEAAVGILRAHDVAPMHFPPAPDGEPNVEQGASVYRSDSVTIVVSGDSAGVTLRYVSGTGAQHAAVGLRKAGDRWVGLTGTARDISVLP